MPRAPVRAPQQTRSQATLDRLCAAAAELLEERHWHEISVAEIATRANSSVGSFYARFVDKDALLDYLDERYAESVIQMTANLAEEVRTSDPTLEELVPLLVGTLVDFHRARPGLIRALVMRARLFREPAYDERTMRMNEAALGLLELLEERVPFSGGGRRCFLAFSFMFSALRDRVLFSESVMDPDPAAATEELTRELSRAMLAYLTAPLPESWPEGPSGRRARNPGDTE